MPQLHRNGPENKGSKTGRNLGICSDNHEQKKGDYGIGMALRRKAGGGIGKGKRLNYYRNEGNCTG